MREDKHQLKYSCNSQEGSIKRWAVTDKTHTLTIYQNPIKHKTNLSVKGSLDKHTLCLSYAYRLVLKVSSVDYKGFFFIEKH